jgi:RND superfamily putative drug exporter
MQSAERVAREEKLPRRRVITARILTSRPVAAVVVAATIAALVYAATGIGRLDLGMSFIGSLPSSDEVRRTAEDAYAGFAPGILGPTEVLLELDGITDQRAGIAALQDLVDREPGVAAVLGPREELAIFGTAITLAPGGDAARLAVILDGVADSAAAIADLEALEARLPALARQAGLDPLPAITVAGETAIARDTVDSIGEDLGRVALVALGLNLLLLTVFMRALVAPLYLLAASVLAYAASLGATAFILDAVFDQQEITYFVPLATAVLLVSLGSDYNVYVAGRIWEQARSRRLREAVAVAAPGAAGAVTVAGITLAASFGLLAVVELRSFREFALLMVVGVLVDTLVVRSALIPGLISLFGERSWWPGRRVQPVRADVFTAAVARRLNAPADLDGARGLAAATLATLGERISRNETRALGVQLPANYRAALGDGRRPEPFSPDELVARVAGRANVTPEVAVAGVRAVLATLADAVDVSSFEHLRAQLTEDYAALLPPR